MQVSTPHTGLPAGDWTMTHTAAEIADTLAHVSRCRAMLMDEGQCPEHPSHHGAVSLDACGALDAIRSALMALQAGITQCEELGVEYGVETIAAHMHDLVSDIMGNAKAQMAAPSYNPHMEDHYNGE